MKSNLNALDSELLARLPTMTGVEQRLGLEIYRQLARGQPVLRSSLAEALEAPPHAVDEVASCAPEATIGRLAAA